MEQQLDAFTQKRFELMIEMASKKLQQEMVVLKENIVSLNSEIGSLKRQISRIQFQPQEHVAVQKTLIEPQSKEAQLQPRKEVEIIDCRADHEKKGEFKSGTAKNTEPIRPRYGNYEPDDVSIDKFFYFGRK
ncbi:MAG: hypothetical protein AABX33_00985 [Nanoarchaeota archaeon]